MEKNNKKHRPCDYRVNQFDRWDVGINYNKKDSNNNIWPNEKIQRKIKVRIPGFSRTKSNAR